ncbi:MAG: hypothetical protein FWH20_04460, partial [Oscillospiraceae bacterium]|nr:hypothetical protein [Oscillospiraceae bacterium]
NLKRGENPRANTVRPYIEKEYKQQKNLRTPTEKIFNTIRILHNVGANCVRPHPPSQPPKTHETWRDVL